MTNSEDLDARALGKARQKIILEILADGPMTAPELIEKTGIPEGRVYQNLALLRKKDKVLCNGTKLTGKGHKSARLWHLKP